VLLAAGVGGVDPDGEEALLELRRGRRVNERNAPTGMPALNPSDGRVMPEDPHASGSEGGPPPEETAEAEDQPTPEADPAGGVEDKSLDPSVEEHIHQGTTVVHDED
jgi:hypothetical protein